MNYQSIKRLLTTITIIALTTSLQSCSDEEEACANGAATQNSASVEQQECSVNDDDNNSDATDDNNSDATDDDNSDTTNDDNSDATDDDNSDATDDDNSDATDDDNSDATDDDNSEPADDDNSEPTDDGLTDFVVIDKNVDITIPAPTLSSVNEFSTIVNEIIAGTWDDWAAIAQGTPDPITDVANAIHFLAAQDDINSTELDQLIYFLRNYGLNGPVEDFSQNEAQRLSNALHAVAKMTDFHSTAAPIGLIQEGYATAVFNLTNSPASDYFIEHLPHLLALTQYYSELSTPYTNDNFGYSSNQLLKVIYDAAFEAQSNETLKTAFNVNMLSVISALRSYGLAETGLDLRWDTDEDKKWILGHLFIALGNVNIIADEATKTRIDSIIIEIFDKVTGDISIETAKKEITSTYLETIGRVCDADDALSDYCIAKPTVDDILSITHQCTANITIRAQGLDDAQLADSCSKMASIEEKFHHFFVTNNIPVNDDLNSKLEVIVYASPEDYEAYGYEFFGNSTNNGGIYLEGDPSVEGNVARFHAMQCPDSWAPYSCETGGDVYNLEHEFVHYLDGRYNLYGSFSYHDNTVSWAEGWAEFISKDAANPRNLDAVVGKTIPLLYNILFMDYGYDNLYPWSYLAMQYLSEQRPDDVLLLAAALRESDRALYKAQLNTITDSDDDGFLNWVLANTAAVAPPAQLIPEANTFGHCDLVNQYIRVSDTAASIDLINTTDTPVVLYWIDNSTGEINFDDPYKTLLKGESYSADYWTKNDRLVVSDQLGNCIAVAVLTEATNTYTIYNSLIEPFAAISTGTSADLYIGTEEQELVDQISANSFDSISALFQITGSNATQVFSNKNMLAVAAEIKNRASSYDSVDEQSLPELIYYLRAAYYVEYNIDDVAPFSDEVAVSIISALRELFNNDSTWVVSVENGHVLKGALVLVDSANLGAEFNDVTIKVLTDYDEFWQTSWEMNQAANAVFTTIFRSKGDEKMKALFTEDDSILDALNNFQLNHRDSLGTDAEFVLVNAVRELSRLYHIEALIPRIRVLVKGIIDTSSNDDETKVLWLAAAGMADYYDRANCGYYDICGFSYLLEKETLSFNYKCSDTLKIRAQDLYNDQAAWICDVLIDQETYFHQTLTTLGLPVEDDNNSSLELVIFDSESEYGAYAGGFFDMDTNNGGMYLEGAPAAEKNQARFIAYEAQWKRPEFHVWNLQHEYVHYLDARYNLYGDFQHGMAVETVWWTEGLAEYISHRNGNVSAINVGKSQEFALSELFKNNYSSGQTRIYTWGYLAVRFMFEQHPEDVQQMLTYLRNDQHSDYQALIDNIATSYDNEWFTWLASDLPTDNSGITEFGPNDVDSAASGQSGNWAGEPVTISTDFSPCIIEVPENQHDTENDRILYNDVIECINSHEDKASFVFANVDGLSSNLTITISGGWGNADIQYKADGWPNAQDNDAIANSDNNEDSLTIQLDSEVYWHYITLRGEFGGVKMEVSTSP